MRTKSSFYGKKMKVLGYWLIQDSKTIRQSDNIKK